MATVNLGSIKFNWQGAYNGATAYAVDDVVSYNGSSYICKLASTGNLPTNTTYWDQMSSAGTNGTDLTTTLTTQGDLVYRDGSGLQRLGAGTAGQVLQTGGAGANPSWGTVSSDFVKLGNVSANGTSSSLYLDGYYTSDYDVYKYFVKYMYTNNGNADGFQFRMNGSTGSQWTSGNYRYSGGGGEATSTQTGGGQHPWGWNTTFFGFGNWTTDSNQAGAFELTVYNPLSTSQTVKIVGMGANGENNYYYTRFQSAYINDAGQTFTGWSVIQQSGGVIYTDIDIYGIKK